MKLIDLPLAVTSAQTSTDVDHLAATAFQLLCDNLISYGNVLSEAHMAALLDVNKLYSHLALGLDVGRVAVPLDTGMGKTQSVVAFCIALHRLSLSGVSVLICQSKVEALCDLKRQLLRLGIPEEAVGLMHTYKHAPEGIDPQGRLLEGYASMPATSTPWMHQFLLVSHQRIRGQKTEQFNVFNERPRNLCIWDESLIASDVQFHLLNQLDIDAYEWAVHAKGHSLCQPVKRYLNECVDRLLLALQEAKAGGPAVVVELPTLSDDHRTTYEEIIKSHWSVDGLTKVRLLQFLDMARAPVRVVNNKDEGIVQYSISVPTELDRVAVLDASWYIRKLERMDATITVIGSNNVGAGLKRYDNVVVHQLFANSGRTSVASKAKAVAWTAKEVAEVIRKDVPLNQGIVIFTFKARAKDDPVLRFRAELESAGIDLDATVEVLARDGQVQHRPRINLLTWGMHEGLNDFSYCENVFLVGVLRQRAISLMASAIGQLDDLNASVSGTELDGIITTEQAHVVFQALGRGSCRMVDNGHAHPMRAWLIHPYIDLQDVLDQIMVGVRWEEWVPMDDSMCKEALIDRTALRIKLALTGLPDDVSSISSRRLKEISGLEGVKPRTFTEARDRAEKSLGSWNRQKNTFHRCRF
jgi:hypothetical protein